MLKSNLLVTYDVGKSSRVVLLHRILILYQFGCCVIRDFYVILDWYKTGAWMEKIVKLYQSKLCSNLRRRRNLESRL
jgi:hypothetical protein